MGAFSPAARQFPGGATTAGGAVAATASTFLFVDSIRSSISGMQSRCRLVQFARHAHSCRSLSSSSSSSFSSSSSSSSSSVSIFSTPRTFPSSSAEHRRREESSRRNLPAPSPQWIDKWEKNGFRSFRRRPQAAVDYRNGLSSDDDEVGTSRSTGSSTMERIVEKLKRFGYIDDTAESTEDPNPRPEKGSVEEIFYAEDGILPDTRGGMSWDLMKEREVLFPWEKTEEKEKNEAALQARRKQSKTSLAELTLPETELRRLRHMAIRTKSKIKIGGSGVTSEIVDRIHEKWKTEEVVRLKCEGPPALNMKRMHEILERKTGGLVIWRSGSSLSLYRGLGYELSKSEKRPIKHVHMDNNHHHDGSTDNSMENDDRRYGKPLNEDQVSSNEMKRADEKPKEIKYEHEVDKLLEDLGPRYEDWAGPDPLPIDADLLPGIVPNYKPPFRLLPYGVRPSLGMKEGTALRRLARVLPPHFALGRSRLHQGLAAAIVRLWEKSSIVKIALKRGVQLTSSERMAIEIQKLTGGILLSRNKDYIVFYRGKDFLSPEVSEALMERERLAKTLQEEEERMRLQASSSVLPSIQPVDEYGSAGTLGETLEADAKWGNKIDEDHKNRIMRASEVLRHEQLVRKLERKLSIADRRLMKAERALGKVEEFLKPAGSKPDPESITDEERFMFRKLGLRMKAFLLLGRRGVFGGTVENMHLHWKYRELVKIIIKAKNFSQVRDIALSLEAESGGVLVSVDKISKGFAIIVFRGKDYHRPSSLRPKNLLTKRKALARSIELQRREALLWHTSNLKQRVAQLKAELDLMEDMEDRGNEDLYARLDETYSAADEEDSEEEGEEAYLETFDGPVDGDNDDDDDDDDLIEMSDDETFSRAMGKEEHYV